MSRESKLYRDLEREADRRDRHIAAARVKAEREPTGWVQAEGLADAYLAGYRRERRRATWLAAGCFLAGVLAAAVYALAVGRGWL